MAEAERDQKTEDATPKKRQDSARKGDVLASRELSAALAIGFGTAWLALAGGWAMRLWAQMLGEGLRLDPQLMRDFDIGAQVVMLMKLARVVPTFPDTSKLLKSWAWKAMRRSLLKTCVPQWRKSSPSRKKAR